MWTIIGYIILIALWLALIGFVLWITGWSVAIGLSLGFYPGVFFAVKNYITSVKEEVTHPFMRIISYISVGIGVAIPVLFPIIMIIINVV